MSAASYEDGATPQYVPGIDDWIIEVSTKLPGVVEGHLRSQVVLTITNFFRKSLAWRGFLGPLTLAAGQNTLTVAATDSDAYVIYVLESFRNGHPLIGYTISAGTYYSNSYKAVTDGVYTDPYSTLTFVPPAPAAGLDDITCIVAYIPTFVPDSEQALPAWIVQQHYERILAGVYARLYAEIAKPYSDAQQAAYWGAKFRTEIAEARALADKNYQQTTTPWYYPSFAGNTRGRIE
jgi:hypothetical protein